MTKKLKRRGEFSTEKCQLRGVAGMMKLENHAFAPRSQRFWLQSLKARWRGKRLFEAAAHLQSQSVTPRLLISQERRDGDFWKKAPDPHDQTHCPAMGHRVTSPHDAWRQDIICVAYYPAPKTHGLSERVRETAKPKKRETLPKASRGSRKLSGRGSPRSDETRRQGGVCAKEPRQRNAQRGSPTGFGIFQESNKEPYWDNWGHRI